MIFKLTGKDTSNEFDNILKKLNQNIDVSQEEIDNTPELKLAQTCVNYSVATDKLQGRDDLRNGICETMMARGSVTIDPVTGEKTYTGQIEKESRLDIVIGLCGSGKSSTVADVISNKFKSRLVDNDDVKKLIPEYNGGWGATVVHEEAKYIEHNIFRRSLLNKENMVLVKVGGNIPKMVESVQTAKSYGYTVNLHYVELDKNIALGRVLSRFAETGRFIEPKIINEKYFTKNNESKIELTYNQLKKGGLIDGYSRWNNNVERGEHPILIEERGSGIFIEPATKDIEGVSVGNGSHGYVRGMRNPFLGGFKEKSGEMEEHDKRRKYERNRSAVGGSTERVYGKETTIRSVSTLFSEAETRSEEQKNSRDKGNTLSFDK